MRTVLAILATILLVAGFESIARGQSDTPSGAFLKPYRNLWNVTVILAKGNRRINVGTWSDEGSFITFHGRPAFKRAQVFKIRRTGAANTTINIFDPATMRPFERDFSTTAGDSRQLRINGTDVEVIEIAGNNRKAPKRTHVTIPRPFYDFSGGMYGLLLAGYPLADRYSAHLTTIAESNQSLQDIPFRVTGRENVAAKPGTKVRAWRVEAVWHEPDPKTNGSLLTFWLTKKPPYIIKLIYASPKLGQTFIYTMA